jgi:hypothetical protein
VKLKKSKKQKDKATVARVVKEMALPRFAESCRKEEESNHRAMKHDTFEDSSGPLQTKGPRN